MERCQLDIALEYDQNGYKALASKDGREPEDDLKKRLRRVNVLVACPPGPEQTAESAGFCSGWNLCGSSRIGYIFMLHREQKSVHSR